MLRSAFRTTTAVVALLLPLAACEGGLTAPDGSEGSLTLTLASAEGAAGDVAAAAVMEASSSPALARVGLDRVSSITVTLDSVQVHPLSAGEDEQEGEENGENGEENGEENGSAAAQQQGPPDGAGPDEEGDGEGGWLTVAADGQEIDLTALPEDGLELASANLPAGDYRGVRLFVSDAAITFSEDVQFGNPNDPDNVFEAGTAHPLDIPSAEQTGVKVPRLSFTVPEGGAETVTLGFDADASVRTVVATGNGTLKMAPVLVGGANGGPGGGPGS